MLIRTLFLASFTLLFATPGNAATLFVAGNANPTNTGCSAAAPCILIDYAVSAAAAGDTIICSTPSQSTAITITKSVTIDCAGTRAAVRDFAATPATSTKIGIIIAISPSDPFQTVRLRGLDIDGFSAGARFLDRGIDIQAATAVYIEDCVISNVKQQGIFDHRTGGHSGLFIKDSVISGNLGAGILAASAAVSGTVLDHVTSENNAFGIAVATGNNVVINRSVFSGNSAAGVEGDAGSQIIVEESKISHNNVGVQSSSSVRVSNNAIAFNNTAFNGAAATMGSNRFSGNGSMGTPLMPISGAPADVGP